MIKLPHRPIGIHYGHLFMGVRTQDVVTMDINIKNHLRCWEKWDESRDIVTIIAKALLSGRVCVAISHTKVSRGKHNGYATSTCHYRFQQNHSE